MTEDTMLAAAAHGRGQADDTAIARRWREISQPF
jgi:hypothetical protein